MEDARLDLMRLVLNLYHGRLARHNGLTRVDHRHTRARLGNLLNHQRRIALIHKAELLNQVTTLARHIAEVVRQAVKDHNGT